MTKKNMIYFISLCMLCIEFILCRYVFFEIHGMKDWSLILFLFGLFVMVISFLLKARLVSIFTAIAYMVGWIAGIIFQTNDVDLGGGRTNSLWILWTVVFIFSVILSVLIQLIVIKKRKLIKSKFLIDWIAI